MARHALRLAVLVAVGSCSKGPALEPPFAPPPARSSEPTSVARLDGGAPAAPPTALAPLPPLPEPWSNARSEPRNPADVCEPAISNVERAAGALLAAARKPAAGGRAATWDPQKQPDYLDRMKERFALTAAELALLRKNRFVVLERLQEKSYARAYHEIYRSELPLYVGADAVFHAVWNGHDAALAEIERTTLLELQRGALEQMHAALPALARSLPDDVAGDLDLYVAVARSLAADALVPGVLGPSPRVGEMLSAARKARGLAQVELFGRQRMVDFSRYRPRGRYAKHPELGPYFRASTWLANLELNLVSRGGRSSAPGAVPDPSETPREALVALGLAELVQRSGAGPAVSKLEAAWSALGGVREDVAVTELAKLRSTMNVASLRDADAFDRLKAAIGGSFPRTTRIHYMPQGSSPLPAITTLLGPRITRDTTALAGLLHSDVPWRHSVRAADVGFVLGHDVARRFLLPELARHPTLEQKLGEGRALVSASPTPDLYSSWLAAIGALGEPPNGALPSYTEQAAFRDHRLGSALAAYGQLRQSFVLVAAQPYDEAGCVVPDGWVDPVPEVYAALARYAGRGRALARSLGSSEVEAYFERLRARLSVLEAIAHQELSGEPLSEEAKRWLSMVVEIVPPSSDGPGSFDGWYFDLFFRRYDAFDSPAFVSDIQASVNTGAVTHIGATLPRLALFVVDVGGAPRVVVGPVARAFEAIAPTRLADASAPGIVRRDPWARAYTAPALAPPRLALRFVDVHSDGDGDVYEIELAGAFAGVRIELLDHHRRLIGSAKAAPRVRVAIPSGAFPEALRIRAGAFSHFEALAHGPFAASVTLGGARPIEPR